MARQPTLHELSMALSPKERAVLLEKLQKSLSVKSGGSEPAVYKEFDDSKTNRKHALEMEYRSMGSSDRFVLWLKGLFSALNREELIQRRVLKKTRQKLQRSPYEIIDSTGEFIQPAFAAAVFELYKHLAVPMKIVRFFWAYPIHLKDAIELTLPNHIPESKSELFDFIPFPSLVELYMKTENKGDIKNRLLDELASYLGRIPIEVFEMIANGILPLYWLREMSRLDFTRLFSLFQVSIDQQSPTEAPDYQPTSLATIGTMLDAFAYALFTGAKTTKAAQVHEDILKYYIAASEYRFESGSLSLDSSDEQKIDVQQLKSVSLDTVKEYASDFVQVPDAISVFLKSVPLADLIKIYHQDPFYRFLAYTPSLWLKDFYTNALQLKLLSELDQQFGNVRNEVINSHKSLLFPRGIKPMQYFCEEAIQMEKAGFDEFAYMKALNTLSAYLRQVFLPKHAEPLRNIARLVPERMRDIQNTLTFQTGTIEELSIQTQRIDDLFNPESEDGKLFFRSRASAARDITLQRSFRTLMSQRDKMVKDVLDKSLEAFGAIIQAIQTLLDSSIESVKNEMAKLVEPSTGKPPIELLKNMENRFGILRKVILLEEVIGEEGRESTSGYIDRI